MLGLVSHASRKPIDFTASGGFAYGAQTGNAAQAFAPIVSRFEMPSPPNMVRENRPGMFGNSALSAAPMTEGGIMPEVPDSVSRPDSLAKPDLASSFGEMKAPRLKGPGFFQSGGLGQRLLQAIGEAGLRYSASEGNPYALGVLRNRWDMQQAQQQTQARQAQMMQERAWKLEDREFEANQPIFRNVSNELVRVDPRNGAAEQVYKGTIPAEDYAAGLGLEPGSEAYNRAMVDYVLRSNGPTAFEYDNQLEGVRQGNRVSLENLRQGNRVALKGTPTYAATHPRAPAAKAPTPTSVIGGILAKQASGKPLTPGEQTALASYGPRGGRRGSGAAMPEPKSAADYARLPSGTQYRAPDGQIRVKQ